jgi:cell division septation protein DedD
LERQRKLEPPAKGTMPAPAPALPESQSQPYPIDPADPRYQPAPPAASMPENFGAKSSDTSQKIQKAPPSGGAIEIKQASPPRTPPGFPPIGVTPEFKDLPDGAPLQTEDGKLALLSNPPSLNLAKAKPEQSANKTNSAPGQVWVVQVASYARETDARAFAAKLKDKGYNVSISSGEVAGQARYRVEIGPLTNRNDAQALQKELATVHKFDQALLLTRPVNSTSPSR